MFEGPLSLFAFPSARSRVKIEMSIDSNGRMVLTEETEVFEEKALVISKFCPSKTYDQIVAQVGA